MVLPLGPGKFYGSSLPRPRYYSDVKFSDHRVDPPVPVLDPLLSWANEAHWSMGGLSLKRLRLQGKIEGNVDRLRKEKEKIFKKKQDLISTPVFKSKGKKSSSFGGKRGRKIPDSPPPAPVSRKLRLRSRVVGGDEEEEVGVRKEEGSGGVRRKRRRLVRKLGDDFDMVANENEKSKRSPLKDVSNGGVVSKSVGSRTRGRRNMVLMQEEEESDSDDAEEIGSVSGKNVKGKIGGEKGSVSPSGTRSLPRLKQKST